MEHDELERYYLCGIGAFGKIDRFEIGVYNKENKSFSFSNGSYGNIELHKEPRGSNATCVMSATCLQKIDDAELLYKYIGNV